MRGLVFAGAIISIGLFSAADNAAIGEWIDAQRSTVYARLAEVSPMRLADKLSVVRSTAYARLSEVSLTRLADKLSAVGSQIAVIASSAPWADDPSQTQKDLYRFAAIERGDLISTVTATGQLKPVATVMVSTQISGQINRISADFNAHVRRGEVIATIDATMFEIAVEQARAELEMANAAVLKANIAMAETAEELDRRNSLLDRNAGSLVDRNKARAAKRLAEAQLLEAESMVQRAEAALNQAQTNVERTRIRSPVDGVVVDRSIEVGQIVAASLEAPTLFTIAQDLHDMQVNMSIDESEIGRISPGHRVEFTVDAYPGRRFTGQVEQIRLAPTTSQNVVTYTVVVKASNPDLLLLPGMTATARIIVNERHEVLKAPTAAIRFRQPGQRSSLDSAVLWLERDGALLSVDVKLGVTDGDMIEIIRDGLTPGSLVAVGVRPVARKESVAKRLIGVF
jgi:HlyD family secretion protein